MLAIELEMPGDLAKFRLPSGVNERLTQLLDRQEGGERLPKAERQDVAGLVHLAEMLTLLCLRAERAASLRSHKP